MHPAGGAFWPKARVLHQAQMLSSQAQGGIEDEASRYPSSSAGYYQRTHPAPTCSAVTCHLPVPHARSRDRISSVS